MLCWYYSISHLHISQFQSKTVFYCFMRSHWNADLHFMKKCFDHLNKWAALILRIAHLFFWSCRIVCCLCSNSKLITHLDRWMSRSIFDFSILNSKNCFILTSKSYSIQQGYRIYSANLNIYLVRFPSFASYFFFRKIIIYSSHAFSFFSCFISISKILNQMRFYSGHS